MRILQVNKFNYLRGGAEQYFLSMTEELQRRGHEVAVFAMKHPKNQPSPWEKYFVTRYSFNEGSLWERVRGAARIIWNREARRKFEALIQEFKPDIIHYHNIYHQLSPSILSVAKKYNIPTVMHLHDYKLISANYSLFSNGHISYEGTAPHYYRCFTHKSFRNSYLKSLVVTLEMYLHHTILKSYEKNIDLYLASSYFMKDICVRYGVPAEKIDVIYNFIFQTKERTSEQGDYLLYFGRLSPEKGVEVLLEGLAQSSTKPPLLIAGAGPLEQKLQEMAEKKKLPVSFLGYQAPSALEPLIRKAGAVVVPSIWFENMPFVLLEALSFGKIVIASKVGGTAEIIKDGENCLVFQTGDSKQLAKKIDALQTIDREGMSEKARASVKDLTLENNCRQLLSIYERLIAK